MKTLARLALAGTALTIVSGCVTSGDPTTSAFRTPDSRSSRASIPVALANETNDRIYNSSYGGAAFTVGTNDEGAKAYAGVMPGSNGGARVTTGTATYSGSYEVTMIEDINVSNNFLTGRVAEDDGAITLRADFDARTLRGRSGNLSVDGRISGSDLSGDVTYRGVRGDLDGVIGDEAAVGAFHGSSSDLVYGGGFIALD